MAIEHTIIEPFEDDKSDYEIFAAHLLAIEQDASLPVPGKHLRIYVPVGTLQRYPNGYARRSALNSLLDRIEEA